MTLLREPKPAAYDNPTLFVTSYWSLCYEEQFYLIVAGLLVVSKALKQSLFWWLAGLALLAVCWNVGVPRLCYGLFIDYWLHFVLGALVFYRLCHFESRLKLLGLVSFSLYLVHQFNMVAIKHLVGAILPPSLGYLQIGGEVICHFALATGFWWLCERPFLNVQRPTAAV